MTKKITIVGLGRSGFAAALLAKETGAQVWVTESHSNDALKQAAAELKQQGISVELGSHTQAFIEAADLIVTSPGVSDESPALKLARENGKKIIDEIEFAYGFCKSPIVAVTGTNGKSTTVTLIAHILEAAGKRAFVLGNIGAPFSGQVSNLTKDDIVVLEVSSFQLSRIDKFKPYIAVFLNATQNHLDRHKDFDDYLRAKLNVFSNQDENDWAILNADDPALSAAAKGLKAQILTFNRQKDHNLENAAAASLACGILDIKKADIDAAVAGFKHLEHRTEFVRELEGITFINDSKSTTPEATLRALEGLDKKTILIAGGRDKGLDYSCVKDVVAKKARAVVLIGEARQKIAGAFNGTVKIHEASSLEQAVEAACRFARTGDAVLLSPMCASFDMFDNFEHRGREFKRILSSLREASTPHIRCAEFRTSDVRSGATKQSH